MNYKKLKNGMIEVGPKTIIRNFTKNPKNRKFKEISHSHYRYELEDYGGKSWEKILSNYGKELDEAEHQIKPGDVTKITIENGEISIETIKCADVDVYGKDKIKYWNEEK